MVRGMTLNEMKLIYVLSFSFPIKLVRVTVPQVPVMMMIVSSSKDPTAAV